MSKAESVNALARGLDLLQEAAHMGPFTLSEMARALGEPTSTVDRWIKTLAEKGLLDRASPTQWTIGLKAAQLWAAYRTRMKQQIEHARLGLARTAIPEETSEWH
ncbi:MAG: helix-turn-helix domain-containing protein [Desulfarculus sp.]|nr:helix-turn-helix domain-containing protein [Desulfarculus sp.]